jgi:heme/copper-type cytochrome/quinol oxidase subunit 2
MINYLLNTPTPLINPTNFPAARFANVNTLISILVPILTIIATLIFGGMLLFAAYQVITAGGEAEKIDAAKQTATNAVVGLFLVVAAFLIVRLLAFIFNLETFI